ncbi:nuclear transport factor 2 family protein [Mycolicibacterium komossense]|uniref:Nuclear transport factor 2 family protein n=1 Tax=Mycolicibacterium komossense TaxID=1779 RepID=A0ABT3CKZ0_9MYCO|nr:nuclear transport factor 2 family protein [Mycolicibacterium komossense]MCV7230104.1 nuclear transport factor 2 family protein [Mycolicibacterium komossense]
MTAISIEERNIAATKIVYAAIPRGDLDTAVRQMDPDIRITYYGTPAIPYAGDYAGMAAAIDFFTIVGTTVAILDLQAWAFIADGDQLATWGWMRFRRLETGFEWESEFAHIITLRDGRWLHFRDFMNSALTHAAFS